MHTNRKSPAAQAASPDSVCSLLIMRLVLKLLLLFPCIACAQTALLERIQTARLLKVCIWPEYYGISFRNPRTNQLAGIDIDMAGELAKSLNAKLEFVDSSFARLIEDVSGGRCDIAMFAIGVTPKRAQFLRFTRPYLESDIYAITSRGNRRIKSWGDIDQPGVVVAVAEGTLHEGVMRDKLAHATLRVMTTSYARELEVESGRADVFMTDFPYSRRMLETTDWARLVSPPGVYHLTPYAYAIKPGDDNWFDHVERFLVEVKRDGRLLASAKRHKLERILVAD
ncbi:MAG: amino acid ABC transporter substrate-binding protein [Rhodocyclaceae bacterium]|nr:amino acid ABC transporter substrate-binding protein [Rhodocyclaceae bacterium]